MLNKIMSWVVVVINLLGAIMEFAIDNYRIGLMALLMASSWLLIIDQQKTIEKLEKIEYQYARKENAKYVKYLEKHI